MQRSELKKYYETSTYTKKAYEKREKLSLQIHHEKSALEEAIVSLPKIPLEEQEGFRKEIAQRSAHLEKMKEELRTHDHVLDTLEEVSPDQIKEQLILQILEEVPESAEQYQNISATLEQLYKEKKATELLLQQLAPLFETLRDGARAKQKRGLFAFIFGHHPKMILARAIQQGIVEAEKIVGKVDEAHASQLIERFLVEAKKPWNRGLYISQFFHFFDEMADLLVEYRKNLAKINEEMNETLSSLDSWIDHYS